MLLCRKKKEAPHRRRRRHSILNEMAANAWNLVDVSPKMDYSSDHEICLLPLKKEKEKKEEQNDHCSKSVHYDLFDLVNDRGRDQSRHFYWYYD